MLRSLVGSEMCIRDSQCALFYLLSYANQYKPTHTTKKPCYFSFDDFFFSLSPLLTLASKQLTKIERVGRGISIEEKERMKKKI